MIFTIALLLISQTDAGRWVQVSRDREGTHYIDAGSVRAVGDRRFMRHRMRLATPLPDGSVTATLHVEITCKARTLALLGGLEQDQAGAIIQTYKYSRPRVVPVSPNSVSERYFHYVCGR
jgi:Surface-adhesin protein E